MTKLTFQTSEVLVEIEVENPRNAREVYNRVAEEYGEKVAAECVELFINGDYLEE